MSYDSDIVMTVGSNTLITVMVKNGEIAGRLKLIDVDPLHPIYVDN